MKSENKVRVMKSVFGFIVACCLCVGCSTKEDLDSRAVIRLGVENTTRASIDNVGELAQYAGDKVGIVGMETTTQVPPVGVWDGVLLMNNVKTTSIDADGTLHWAGAYYYPMDITHFVKFCAYHPYAVSGTSGANYLRASSDNTAPVLHFTLTGQEDVMYASPVVGNYSVAPGKLSFKHALTQLSFELDDPDGTFSGVTLNGITVQEANTTCSMNIETGALGEWGNPKSLELPGIANIPINAVGSKQVIDGEIMLQPGLSSFAITVKTSIGDFADITVTPTSNGDGSPATVFSAEQAYRITLRFAKKSPIAMTASVTEWVFGGTGSGVVE